MGQDAARLIALALQEQTIPKKLAEDLQSNSAILRTSFYSRPLGQNTKASVVRSALYHITKRIGLVSGAAPTIAET